MFLRFIISFRFPTQVFLLPAMHSHEWRCKLLLWCIHLILVSWVGFFLFAIEHVHCQQRECFVMNCSKRRQCYSYFASNIEWICINISYYKLHTSPLHCFRDMGRIWRRGKRITFIDEFESTHRMTFRTWHENTWLIMVQYFFKRFWLPKPRCSSRKEGAGNEN